MTTTVLNTKISKVGNEIKNTSSLVTTTILKKRLVEKKIPDNSKYITTQELNKLAAGHFATTISLIETIWVYLRLALFFAAHCGKNVVAIFWDFFTSINKVFILTEGMGNRLSYYEV